VTLPAIEVELKYRVGEAAAGRLAGVRSLGPFRAAGRSRQVQVEDRYLDTADGALGRAGYAARLRRGPSMTLISVKSTTPTASALHRREELEGPADLSLDPRAWPPSPARSLILEHAGDAPLLELVTVRQLRRTRPFADEASEVEVSLDEVAVVHGGRVVDRFLELEVELRRGPSAGLAALAASLAGDPDLTAERATKLERALAAVAGAGSRARRRAAREDRPAGEPGPGEPEGPGDPERRVDPEIPDEAERGGDGRADDGAPAPDLVAVGPATPATPAAPAAGTDASAPAAPPRLVAGRTPGVTADDSLAEAGRKVLRFHFARMLAREAGTRSGEDSEDLHSMRVATRRMRAAWRIFGDGFRSDRTGRLRRRLRFVAGRLGAVRDLDVLIHGAESHQQTLGARPAAALEPLVAAWRTERAVARSALLRMLDGAAYERLVEDYRVFVATEGAAAAPVPSPVAPHHVRDTAGSRIWLAYEQVRAYETVLRWADIETVHQLRIAAKWLRYSLEFFREALGPEADALIARVVALQDHLGLLHDADVAIALTRAFLVANAGTLTREQTQAIGAFLAHQERELARLRRTMGGPWRAVSGATFRRLLGRAIAAL